MDYYERAGLTPYLEKLGFNLVGYGCTTCIGNSGPLPEAISAAVNEHDLAVVSVLSGNRNFEGRINPDVKMNYLASPPLVVAYALAGTMDIDLANEPLGDGRRRAAGATCATSGRAAPRSRTSSPRRSAPAASARRTRTSSPATSAGSRCPPRPATRSTGRASRPTCASPRTSRGWRREPQPVADIAGARVLAKLGDSVTTDHISPAGSIKADSPAGTYLAEHGVAAARVQLLRLPARQPRGDDPGHVRQHPAAQPARAGGGGRLHGQPPDRRADLDLRRLGRLPGGGHPAGDPGRQGVRLGLVAGLGGQGHHAARRTGGHRRVVRADPPLQPDRYGRAAAAVPGGRHRRVARA